MIHEVLVVGPLQCNCSIHGDEQTGEAIVIDPGDGVERILEVLDRRSLKVTAIVATHGHIDHVGGVGKLHAATGARVYMNSNDLELLEHLDSQASWLGMEAPGRIEVDAGLREGDVLRAGSTEFRVLYTPGHTQGGVCLWIPAEKTLIAGDTIFRDGIGRTDLPGGDTRQLLTSIKEKLLSLPEETAVIPGHGPETTIGREKESNYFLRELRTVRHAP